MRDLAASLGALLFAKTLSCTVSVVKTDCVQDRVVQAAY